MRHLLRISGLVVLLGLSQLAVGAPFPTLPTPEPLAPRAALTLTITLKLDVVSGPDTDGLDSATLTFEATFLDPPDPSSTYDDSVCGDPCVSASSHMLTITGASVPATNGIYSDAQGFTFLHFPGAGGGFFIDDPVSFTEPEFSLPTSGEELLLGLVLDPGSPVPGDGDPVSATDFGAVDGGSSSLLVGAGGVPTTVYSVEAGFTPTVTPTGGPTDGSGGMGTIIIEKQTLPDGDPATFTFTGDVSGTLSDGGTAMASVAAGTYTSTETVPAGWALTSIVCDDGDSSGDTGTATATFEVVAGETVTCVFTNTKDGTILIEKQTLPDGDPTTFDFSGDVSGTLGDGGTAMASVVPGTYTSTETVPAGWALTSISCDDGDSTGDTGTATATFEVAAGETVTCTFTNTKNGTILIEKQTDPDGDPTTFTFTGDVAGTLGDGGTAMASVAPGTYTSTETVPAGWDLTSIVCDDGDSSGDTGTATATFEVAAGETVTCVFTNTVTEPDEITADKDSILRPGAKHRNEGANPLLHVGEQRRQVVGFDLSMVNLSGLTSATLVLTINDENDPGQWGPNGRTLDVHRLLEDWVEGNGKAYQLPGPEQTRGSGSGVTWNCGIDTAIENQQSGADCVNPNWGGGTFEATATDQFLMTNGATGEVSWDVTVDVIAGFDSWLIKKTQGNGNARFYAKDHPDVVGTPDLAPRLVLDFSAASPRVEAVGGEQQRLELEVPSEYALEPNYPNPFNPQTTIRFEVPESAHVTLIVYDVLGRQVRVLVDGSRAAGTYEVVFDASNLPSGTYLYRLETPQGSFVQTMQLVK